MTESGGGSAPAGSGHGREGVTRLRDRPIPDLAELFAGGEARGPIPVAGEDPRGAERLVEVRSLGVAGENRYHAAWNPPYHHSIPGSIPDLLVRESVAHKLAAINARLAGSGIELFLFDGYRPVAVQNYFYFDWVPKYLRGRHPHRDEEWIVEQTGRYWARGARSRAEIAARTPPHATGGAVDLGLRHADTGQLLEMGTMFDDISERSRTDHFERHAPGGPSGFTEEEALGNRRLLFHLMHDEGFANHPAEWWHYTHGDQSWARRRGAPAAFYGYAGPLAGETLADE